MSGTSKANAGPWAIAGRKRSLVLLIGLVAAVGLIGVSALPGLAGGTGKIYTLVVTPSQATAGQSTDFSVTMTNKTPGNSSPNSFSVTAPAGFAVTSAAISSASNPNPSATVTVVGSMVKVKYLSPVKTNQYVTLRVTATPPTSACGTTATWTAKVWTGSSLSGETFRLNNPGTDQRTTVVCAPSLSVTKTPVTTPVSVGDDVQFDVTVSNAPGAGTATNVGVSDTLPAGLTWSIASDPGGACSIETGVLTCTIPALTGGSTYSVRVTAPAVSAGTVTNDGATVTLDGEPVASAGSASIDALAPGLNALKTADEPSVTAGDQIGYTIDLLNTGEGVAKDVVATDTLPTDAGLAWIIESQDGAACSIEGGVLTCTIPTLEPTAGYSVHITSPTTSATVADSPVENTVSVTADNSDPLESSAAIEVWEGQLGCPSIQEQGFEYTATTSGAGPSLGQLARLENLDGSTCVAKPYNFSSLLQESSNVISFTQGSVAGQGQAQFVMQIDWEPLVPGVPNVVYPTTIAGRTTMIQYSEADPIHAIEWCLAVEYDLDGNVVTATPPEGESWCLADQAGVLQPDGKVAVTEILYGLGDPKIFR